MEENDALGGSSDSAYTQGLRLRWEFGVWPKSTLFRSTFRLLSFSAINPDTSVERDAVNDVRHIGSCHADDTRSARPCGLMSIGIAQTMYTPPDLLSTRLNPRTRPYAGFLSGTIAGTVLYPHSSITTELAAGVLGPSADARATQSLAHWTMSWPSPEPQGWANQLHDSFQFTLRDAFAGELLEYCRKACNGSMQEERIFDVVPDAEVVVGTLMNRATIGGSAHLGYRFADLVTPFRIPTSAPPGPGSPPASHFWNDVRDLLDVVRRTGWCMAFVQYDGRYVQQNALISGSYNDRGPTRWRGESLISLEHTVAEYGWGLSGGVGRVSLGWQQVNRTAEYKPGGGPHRFGSFYLSLFSPSR